MTQVSLSDCIEWCDLVQKVYTKGWPECGEYGPKDVVKAIRDHLSSLATQEPDWWYCDIDPDESGDSAYEAMYNHRARLEPVELHSSYIGPRKWGVMHPSKEDDGEDATTFDTKEEAQKFCHEWKEKSDDQ